MEKRIPKIVVPPSLTEKEDVNKHFHEELDPCIKFIIECINDWQCIKDGVVLDTDSSKEERENFLNLSLHIDELKILVEQLLELQKIHTSSFLYVLRCEEITKIVDLVGNKLYGSEHGSDCKCNGSKEGDSIGSKINRLFDETVGGFSLCRSVLVRCQRDAVDSD